MLGLWSQHLAPFLGSLLSAPTTPPHKHTLVPSNQFQAGLAASGATLGVQGPWTPKSARRQEMRCTLLLHSSAPTILLLDPNFPTLSIPRDAADPRGLTGSWNEVLQQEFRLLVQLSLHRAHFPQERCDPLS